MSLVITIAPCSSAPDGAESLLVINGGDPRTGGRSLQMPTEYAQEIMRAVNNHDALLSACRRLVPLPQTLVRRYLDNQAALLTDSEWDAVHVAYAAIAAAEGGTA